eukprot:scaffold7328_cov314-Pinguiococcus_pyrenoidosus.AAC.90
MSESLDTVPHKAQGLLSDRAATFTNTFKAAHHFALREAEDHLNLLKKVWTGIQDMTGHTDLALIEKTIVNYLDEVDDLRSQEADLKNQSDEIKSEIEEVEKCVGNMEHPIQGGTHSFGDTDAHEKDVIDGAELTERRKYATLLKAQTKDQLMLEDIKLSASQFATLLEQLDVTPIVPNGSSEDATVPRNPPNIQMGESEESYLKDEDVPDRLNYVCAALEELLRKISEMMQTNAPSRSLPLHMTSAKHLGPDSFALSDIRDTKVRVAQDAIAILRSRSPSPTKEFEESGSREKVFSKQSNQSQDAFLETTLEEGGQANAEPKDDKPAAEKQAEQEMASMPNHIGHSIFAASDVSHLENPMKILGLEKQRIAMIPAPHGTSGGHHEMLRRAVKNSGILFGRDHSTDAPPTHQTRSAADEHVADAAEPEAHGSNPRSRYLGDDLEVADRRAMKQISELLVSRAGTTDTRRSY